jgi:hypothetical protein
VLVGFCVANEYWEAFDFGDAFAVWAHLLNFNLVFVSNFKWVTKTSTAVFRVSGGTFLWANNTSSSNSTIRCNLKANHDSLRFLLQCLSGYPQEPADLQESVLSLPFRWKGLFCCILYCWELAGG